MPEKSNGKPGDNGKSANNKCKVSFKDKRVPKKHHSNINCDLARNRDDPTILAIVRNTGKMDLWKKGSRNLMIFLIPT